MGFGCILMWESDFFGHLDIDWKAEVCVIVKKKQQNLGE